jgi:uncharacterized protein YyaL (SSP411 family)
MNRLAKEKSAYLQHAAHQKIDWYPWCEEAFDRALREDKPVFLSSGAVWCHWCHVMAKESFEDDETASILNEHYIAVKLDRDERPDIDRRYQRALAAMGFGGGWPLSMFLTPDRKPFYGGTYFPPLEMYGRPSFKALLVALSKMYKENREAIADHGNQLFESLAGMEIRAEQISEPLLDDAVSQIIMAADTTHGGFGAAPKFAMSGALEFLLSRYALTGDGKIGAAAKKALDAMARGGFHDQLGGGFHRYSTDQKWLVPHFEKMADDNAWLLRNYSNAYSIFGDSFYKEVAKGIVAFVRAELSHPRGGFFASQDADVTPNDEGGYFTWTADDFKRLLDEEEEKILSLFFFDDAGTMHHDPSKKVLAAQRTMADVAAQAGVDPLRVSAVLQKGKAKLLQARNGRQKPFVDNAMYTSLNGMLISAFLKAYRVFKDEAMRDFALLSLDTIMELRLIDGELYHSDDVRALLDDYAYLGDALAAAYEATGNGAYLEQARTIMEQCLARFWDGEEGGFFDTEEAVLGMRLKGIEDTPHPSANAVVITVLLKLSFMCREGRFRDYAREALQFFVSQGKTMGLHGGYYFCALDGFFNMAELTVHAQPESALAENTRALPYPCLAITYGDDRGYVVPCLRNVCYAPITDAASLSGILSQKKT